MIDPPTTVEPEPDPDPSEPEPEVKNGIVEENGSLYYYVDGVLTRAGLIQIDGDYYYVKTSSGEVVHGRTYWITVTNGLLPSGQYAFADDGKMILS
jgi:glucan-binding YG repeat protein